ncbi:uncharacterized protein [Typha latifolia]|uniref:uncharacterized protein n=1 Tax=Typha latifolia TaxID=4733 RepID=UPI003C2E109C
MLQFEEGENEEFHRTPTSIQLPLMSSPSASASPVGPNPDDHGRRMTFWCNDCQAAVALPQSSPPPHHCPACLGSSLESLDGDPPSLPDDDSFLGSASESELDYESETDNDDDVPEYSEAPDAADPSLAPAPESAIDALPIVAVSDPSQLCAVCADVFEATADARRLPCGHVYHYDCVVPWLLRRNSCPLCRAPLPEEGGDDEDRRATLELLREVARRRIVIYLSQSQHRPPPPPLPPPPETGDGSRVVPGGGADDRRR